MISYIGAKTGLEKQALRMAHLPRVSVKKILSLQAIAALKALTFRGK